VGYIPEWTVSYSVWISSYNIAFYFCIAPSPLPVDFTNSALSCSFPYAISEVPTGPLHGLNRVATDMA